MKKNGYFILLKDGEYSDWAFAFEELGSLYIGSAVDEKL